MAPAHSVSAGLDYPGVGPEHSHLQGFGTGPGTCRYEMTRRWRRSTSCPGPKGSFRPWRLPTPWRTFPSLVREDVEDGPILVCLSGRGDKDVAHVARLEKRDLTL